MGIRGFLGYKARRLAELISPPPPIPNLSGGRFLEWSYLSAWTGRVLKPGFRVLDFGCGKAIQSFGAGLLDAEITAIDLQEQDLDAEFENLNFRNIDVMELNETEKFNLVLSCSAIEHVGLYGRYDAPEQIDGDLLAMRKMKRLLNKDGWMFMTIPVGRDAVIRPLHRIYGVERLPRLLEGYTEVDSRFWIKTDGRHWVKVERERALNEPGSAHYYGLGLFALQPEG